MTVDTSKFFHRAVPILIGLLLLGRVIGMAQIPLMDTTEARYAEIGRKMAELNDWVTPWFAYGVPFWGKPPLAFWVTAISFKLFGVSEFAARLPHLIVSLIIIALAGWLAGRRDRDAALPAVATIFSSALYLVVAGAVMTDIELVLGTSLAMAGFWIALEEPDRGSRGTRWFAGLLFFGGLALGLLAKGPVALVLAGTPLLLWTAYNRRWLDVWRGLPWIPGLLATLAIALPWYWIAEQRTPGFLEYFLVGEHWHRFVTSGWQGDRYGHVHRYPIGTIWAFAFVDTLPWSLLLPLAWWLWRKSVAASTTTHVANTAAAGSSLPGNEAVGIADRSDRIRCDDRAWQGYLLTWALAPLVFFTASRHLLLTYVLPGLPAAAILVGGWLARKRRQGRPVDCLLSIGLLIVFLFGCGFGLGADYPFYLKQRSLKALVAAYDQERAKQTALTGSAPPGAQSNVPLIFIVWRPYSAQFYSHGRAIKAMSQDEAWLRIGSGAAYVVTRYGNDFTSSAVAPAGAGAMSGKTIATTDTSAAGRVVTRLGRYAEYDLFFIPAR